MGGRQRRSGAYGSLAGAPRPLSRCAQAISFDQRYLGAANTFQMLTRLPAFVQTNDEAAHYCTGAPVVRKLARASDLRDGQYFTRNERPGRVFRVCFRNLAGEQA